MQRNILADIAVSVALSQARKQENAARRAAAQANPELVACLLERSKQRGQSEIDWPEYFRNAYMVD